MVAESDRGRLGSITTPRTLTVSGNGSWTPAAHPDPAATGSLRRFNRRAPQSGNQFEEQDDDVGVEASRRARHAAARAKPSRADCRACAAVAVLCPRRGPRAIETLARRRTSFGDHAGDAVAIFGRRRHLQELLPGF